MNKPVFIKLGLHDTDGRVLYINSSYISSMCLSISKEFTAVVMFNNFEFSVSETPEQIMELIRKSSEPPRPMDFVPISYTKGDYD